ncbi:sodium/calcium exchanger 3 isoform X1 [Eurytemora carolleeae]|uniref:sodium/calcium exchanger 3 isoform X1 n=1 Tax=Eurytemora carolleeae TaxID=1294199 RepID=UPI000C755E4A|nr:sodium/calcium exchanger 3 isoform X1 [Eurytemora carolleeae]XP_023324236.1 sodium/calcium exchanger 3 isoform X1 [Eurytemora carolleeae]|eukprot:XP_023324230.1 sodium/calcium exchanger 3-like isoform X1 [Eurytemora affinis]
MAAHLRHAAIFFALLACATQVSCSAEGDEVDISSEGINCEDGLIVPLWPGTDDMSLGDRFGRGLLYSVLMIYLFIGVAIASDKFMESIEMITAQEKEVSVKDPRTGKTQVIIVKVWNETVANLTLMALGSSAPEIMLSVIEIWAKGFHAGDLGPGTIVGSAAFNLFMIIGLCQYVIPDDEVRKIKHLRVFFITATWSVFAYVWLYMILGLFSYGVVEIWEGVLTFLFFPATVYTAFVADRRMFFYKYFDKKYRAKNGVIVQSEKGDIENRATEKFREFEDLDDMDPALAEFERNRREYINAMKRIRLENPNISLIDLETKAREEVMAKGPKSRAYYRAQATRKLAGKEDAMKAMSKTIQAEAEAEKAAMEASAAAELGLNEKKDDGITRVMFDPPHYTVMESVGTFEVTIVREGGDLNSTIQVDYKTEDGSASSDGDYIEAIGTLTFGPGETQKMVTLEVLDDDVFEEDEHFYIRISNLRRKDGKDFSEIDVVDNNGKKTKQPSVQLGTPHMATIMILDDDHGGIFGFEDSEAEIVESVGIYELKVQRISGARGKVAVSYSSEDGTAKAGTHYEAVEGELLFENEETEKIIELPVLDEESYEKSLIMYVNLGEPRQIAEGKEGEGIDYSVLDAKDPEALTEEEKIALLGRPCLGTNGKVQIRIKESKEFKNSVDKMMQKANASMMVGSSSWLEQFTEAFNVQAEDDDEEGEEGEGEEKMPSCGDYIMHFLTLPWKIIFALIPPTAMGSGYPTFVVSISAIGLCTAVIGDVAGHLGCFINLKDCVNAIAFVALGTSVPDTFASKTAAIEDETADASVGNVTGSNAVNVFLGIGIAWTMAAIYWEFQPEGQFVVPVGSLGFSVTVFCIEALLAIAILMARRSPMVGGELGGPKSIKTINSGIFVFFWVFYVLISALEAYKVIDPGF